jgi:copper(I)-binding protein
MKKFWAVLTILTMFVGIDFSGKAVKVEEVWARASLTGATTGAAYLTIDNKTDEDDTLISVSSEISASAKVQEVIEDNGYVEVHDVESVSIPAGKNKVLKPHGLFIELSGLKKPLVEGEKFSITLTFTKQGAVEKKAHIEQATATLYENY